MPETSQASFQSLPLLDLDPDALEALSRERKLSLLREDMLVIQAYFQKEGREPTDVELEVIAQTWSEHCKHRIFGARIEHRTPAGREVIDGLFKTFIKDPTERIMAQKPGLVVSAFVDNAGFIRVDQETAVCLKAETHNHPSAIEPYAGANTGLGGVIRDILGAGKGAKPIASLDVFCFGQPDTPPEQIKGQDVIHPLGVMRGVVRGVRDYGNRMGIPTVSGAIQFDDCYIYNPLVYCGTAGVIPIRDIPKEVKAGMKVLAAGGRTGKDGLKGATFSSASLTTGSHEEDQQAVQIGNPIEEKKVGDFILEARDEGLIDFITDCGAGGFSSAAGEMLSECGGSIYLENCPLKAPGLTSWEIFLSESQERMVMAAEPEKVARLQEIADRYETELSVLGEADGSGVLKVTHHGVMVCELRCGDLHDAPRRSFVTEWSIPEPTPLSLPEVGQAGPLLREVLGDFNVCSRSPIIREYDHEVMGHTLLKPLAGAQGDAPQDGSVIDLGFHDKAAAISLGILPEWGKTDPFAMGAATVDECVRQLVLVGADPDEIGLLDNFCMGNPDDPRELGALVECVKGMSAAAVAFGAPFISGKDSFYNFFETEDGSISIPTTLLASGIGIVHHLDHILGSSLRRADSVIGILGATTGELGGSVLARRAELGVQPVPATEAGAAMASYRDFHEARRNGLFLSAHDCSEGGLVTALAEMGFSGKGGLEIDLEALPVRGEVPALARLFAETPSRILLEISPEKVPDVLAVFSDHPFALLGQARSQHADLVVTQGETPLLRESLSDLKALWKSGLKRYY
ncbi:MAG: phosphoribosylformylglycinamidine synthase subunit PurL [Verrucomicrobiota bacterium]